MLSATATVLDAVDAFGQPLAIGDWVYIREYNIDLKRPIVRWSIAQTEYFYPYDPEWTGGTIFLTRPGYFGGFYRNPENLVRLSWQQTL